MYNGQEKQRGDIDFFSSSMSKMRFIETVLFILSLNEYLAMSRLPWGSDGKESARNAGNLGLIPGLGKIP